MFTSTLDVSKSINLNNWGVTLINAEKDEHSQIVIETVEKNNETSVEAICIYIAEFMGKNGPMSKLFRSSRGKATGEGVTRLLQLRRAVNCSKKAVTYIKASTLVQEMIDAIKLEEKGPNPNTYYWLGSTSVGKPSKKGLKDKKVRVHNCSTWAESKLWEYLGIPKSPQSISNKILRIPTQITWNENDYYKYADKQWNTFAGRALYKLVKISDKSYFKLLQLKITLKKCKSSLLHEKNPDKIQQLKQKLIVLKQQRIDYDTRNAKNNASAVASIAQKMYEPQSSP